MPEHTVRENNGKKEKSPKNKLTPHRFHYGNVIVGVFLACALHFTFIYYYYLLTKTYTHRKFLVPFPGCRSSYMWEGTFKILHGILINL